MIAIVDHSGSDSRLLEEAFDRIGAAGETAQSIERLHRASRIVVAGRGPYAPAARSLRDSGMIGSIVRAITEGRPYLGIGFGLDLLFDVVHDGGQHTGLGIVPGKVSPLDYDPIHPVRRQCKVPHVGWTSVRWTSECPLLAGLSSGESFFFDHATHAQPLDDREALAFASHGRDIAAVVGSGRAFGTQFIPHKSQTAGLQVLHNFAGL